MEKSIRNKLEEPFDSKHIMTRTSSSGGPKLQYVEGAQYIQRFNDATEGDWSYVVVEYEVTERTGDKDRRGRSRSDLVVLVEVRAFGQVRQAFGGSVTPAGECRGDDWKAALTDALKKGIASFGVALDLYTKGELSKEGADDEGPQDQESLITERQRNAITALSKTAGLEAGRVRAKSFERFQRDIDDLSAAQAADLIALIQEHADRRKGDVE